MIVVTNQAHPRCCPSRCISQTNWLTANAPIVAGPRGFLATANTHTGRYACTVDWRTDSGVTMKWLARSDVGSIRSSSHFSGGEWERWFAWYPVRMATSKFSIHWVALQFVERKWSTGIYGTGRKQRRYRLPKKEVNQRLRHLAELSRKLDGAWSRARSPDRRGSRHK